MTVTLNFEDFPNLASELENSKPGATVTANVVMNLNSTDEGSATLSIDSLQVSKSKEQKESEDAQAVAQEDSKSAVALVFGDNKKKGKE
jgi:hypothetical protein